MHPEAPQRLRPAPLAFALAMGMIGLTGCASQSTLDSPAQVSSAGLPQAAVEAVCADAIDEARKLAEQAVASDAGDRGAALMLAYTTERSGQALAAREAYRGTVETGDRRLVTLACGDNAVMRGGLADVAFFRVRTIDRALADLGVRIDRLPVVRADERTGLSDAGDASSPVAPPMEPRPGFKPPAMTRGIDSHKAPEEKTTDGTPATDKPTTDKPADHGTAPPATGAFFAHLASFKSHDRATQAWGQFKGAGEAARGDRGPTVQSTDLGARGTFYRLGVAFDARADAERYCAAVKTTTRYCSVFGKR